MRGLQGRSSASYTARFSSVDREKPGAPAASDLLVSVATVGKRRVLSAVGYADATTIGLLRAGLETVRGGHDLDVWVDLTHVRGMDATAAHALFELQCGLGVEDRCLVIVCPPGAARHGIATAGLADAFTIFDDFATAHVARRVDVALAV